MRVSLAIHVIGLVLWVGGVVLLPRIMKIASEGTPEGSPVRAIVPRVFFGYIVPGFVLALLSGLFQFMAGGGAARYMKEGWFHGKLTFIILLLVATALLAGEVSKLRAGEKLSVGKLGAIHGIAALSLIVAVGMTLVR